MSKEITQSIEKALEDKPKKKANTSWSAFLQSTVVNFVNEYEIEKMTIEDGEGNKAKLTRQKDNSIKVEISSVEYY